MKPNHIANILAIIKAFFLTPITTAHCKKLAQYAILVPLSPVILISYFLSFLVLAVMYGFQLAEMTIDFLSTTDT